MTFITKTIKKLIYLLLGAVIIVLPAQARVWDVDAPGLQRAIEAQERHTDTLLSRPGIVGTAVGMRGDGSPVIKVYVEHGLVRDVPGLLDGVPVVPEVTGRIYARDHKGRPHGPGNGGGGGGDTGEEPAVDPTARFDRPVPIGVSTGHPDITAGTIGARVTDGVNVYALSNNHVYANENLASVNDSVIQPGSYDGGSSPVDDIGNLHDYEPIIFSTNADNQMDAAIALSSSAALSNSTPSDGYGTPGSTPVDAVPGMRVTKYGRTTGQTSGRVDAINATVNVGYDAGVARFVGQVIIRPGTFSAGGDSGSLIVVRSGRDAGSPVGLLFAGSSAITIANPIQPVLDRFGVTIDGN